MAKIRKIKKVGAKKKSPVINHSLNKTPFKKKSKTTNTTMTPLTIREHNKAITLYQKHYKKGVTVKTALDMSLDVDFKRNKEELSSVYVRTIQDKSIFVFTVKSSGKHNFNEYGVSKNFIAKKQDVHISWDLEDIKEISNAKEILLNTPIKFECSCGRHTYWFRYIATKTNSSLGIQEHRFPSRNNKELKGLFCKHLIRTIQVVTRPAFLKVFERHLANKINGKNTRISHRDKGAIASSSFFLKK